MAVRMLLVDDMQNMVALMKELCSSLGHVEVAATSATEAEAIDWLRMHPKGWDVVVLDLVLAQGSGIGLIARARAANPAGYIAVFSGYASAGVEAHCRRLGADAVFDKRDTGAFIEWLDALGKASADCEC